MDDYDFNSTTTTIKRNRKRSEEVSLSLKDTTLDDIIKSSSNMSTSYSSSPSRSSLGAKKSSGANSYDDDFDFNDDDDYYGDDLLSDSTSGSKKGASRSTGSYLDDSEYQFKSMLPSSLTTKVSKAVAASSNTTTSNKKLDMLDDYLKSSSTDSTNSKTSTLLNSSGNQFSTSNFSNIWNANDSFLSPNALAVPGSLAAKKAASMNKIASATASAVSLATATPSMEDIQPIEVNDVFKEKARNMINKLLDLPQPRLDERMVDFLSTTAAMEIFLSYIVRPASTTSTTGKSSNSLNNSEMENKSLVDLLNEQYVRERDVEDKDAMRYSYQVMELLVNRSPQNQKLIDHRFNDVMTYLFKVMDPTSEGNFHHFRRVIDHFMIRNDRIVLDLFFGTHGTDSAAKCPLIRKPYLVKLLLYCYHSAIQDVFLSIIFAPVKQNLVYIRKERFTQLLEMEVIETLVDLMNTPYAIMNKGAAELFGRVVEEAARIEDSHILFMSFVNNPSGLSKLVERIKTAVGSPASEAWKCQIECLHALVVKSKIRIPRITPGGFLEAPAGMNNNSTDFNLSETRIRLIQNLGKSMKSVTEILPLINDMKLKNLDIARHTGVRAPSKPFMAARSMLLEIIYHVVKEKDVHDDLEFLAQLPYKMMVGWFFEYRFNNHYHSIMYKILYEVLSIHHLPGVRAMFKDTKFISRMINHFQDKALASECRGFIVLICNTIRLIADKRRNGYLDIMLKSHHQWQMFVPVLVEETLKQIGPNGFDVIGVARPLPFTCPVQHPVTADAPTNSVDLGSQYAQSIGVFGLAEDVSPVERNMSISVSASASGSLLNVGPGGLLGITSPTSATSSSPTNYSPVSSPSVVVTNASAKLSSMTGSPSGRKSYSPPLEPTIMSSSEVDRNAWSLSSSGESENGQMLDNSLITIPTSFVDSGNPNQESSPIVGRSPRLSLPTPHLLQQRRKTQAELASTGVLSKREMNELTLFSGKFDEVVKVSGDSNGNMDDDTEDDRSYGGDMSTD